LTGRITGVGVGLAFQQVRIILFGLLDYGPGEHFGNPRVNAAYDEYWPAHIDPFFTR
jgi:hypothetical protein